MDGIVVQVKDVMSRHLVAVSLESGLENALKMMSIAKVGVAPVLNNGKLVGILKRREAEALQGNGFKVKEVMHKPAYSFGTESIHEAGRKLVENGITRLPVVDNENDMTCIGIITSTEIANEMKKEKK